MRFLLRSAFAVPLVIASIMTLHTRTSFAGTITVSADAGGVSGTVTQNGTSQIAQAVVDASNFAEARADAATGSLGIGMSTNLPDGPETSFRAAALAQMEEGWTPVCAPGASCIVAAPVSVALDFHLHGLLSADWFNPAPGSDHEFGGHINVDRDSLSLQYVGGELVVEFCNATACGPTQRLTRTDLADGSALFDDSLSVQTFLPGTFVSEMVLEAAWDSVREPSLVGFLDTISFDIVSNDPQMRWVSDSGRMSLVADGEPPPATDVSEPGTLLLLAAGIAAGLLFYRRRIHERLGVVLSFASANKQAASLIECRPAPVFRHPAAKLSSALFAFSHG